MEVDYTYFPDNLDRLQTKALYRLIQEGMTNAFEDDDYVKEAMVAAGSILISPRVAGNLIHHVYGDDREAFRQRQREMPPGTGS